MPMITNNSGTLVAKSVDDHLGPGATRFFGSGYRRVDYTVSGAEPTANAVRAVVHVHHPVDWSKKGEDKELRPHLSTVDVLILAVRAAETLTSRTHGLDAAARRRTWIRRVDIKAPNKPIEDGFTSLPFSAQHPSTEPTPDGRAVSTLDCRVSAMRVRIELVHDLGGSHAEVDEDLGTALGAGYPGLYGTGFQRWRQFIDEVLTDVREDVPARADAMVLVEPPTDGRPDTGPESARGPVVSMIDSFVVALQLGQVLLYETDGLSRAESDTLWMRTTTITAGPPADRRAGLWFPTTTELHDSSLLHARGETWRTATIVGGCFGVITRCAVAHRVPSRNS
jgi:avirulence D protein (AvrD)